jgi:hypothetical protein
VVCFRDVFSWTVNRQNQDYRGILQPQYLEGGGKESLDTLNVFSLGPGTLPDEVSWEVT